MEKNKGIPLFITKRMRFQLYTLGFNDEVISSMRPEEAHRAINEGLTRNEFLMEKIENSFNRIMMNKLVTEIYLN
jgi:hypothetical protein